MSFAITPHGDSNVVEVKVSGKLTAADYDAAMPQLDHFVAEHGKARMLFDVRDFHGWKINPGMPRALWEDFMFGLHHRHDIERLAMIGDKAWHKWSSKTIGFIIDGQVKYFDQTMADEAANWIDYH